jgi:hypothetical protein
LRLDRGFNQDRIPCVIAECIVDLLELLKVNQQERQRCRPVFANPIHLDAKPAARTSDCCRFTRYGFLDERIIDDAFIEPFKLKFRGSK